MPGRQVVIAIELPSAATVEQAIRTSGILSRFPEISLEKNPVGIFGRRATLETPVNDGDRVEIYRSLVADPKAARRARAARKR